MSRVAEPSDNIPEPGKAKPRRQEWTIRKTAYGMEVGVAHMYVGVEGQKPIEGVQVMLPFGLKLGQLFVIRAETPEAAMWDNPDRNYDCVKSYEPFEASIDDALAWIETVDFQAKHTGGITDNGCIVIFGQLAAD